LPCAMERFVVRFFPSLKTILVVLGLLGLMGWAYLNDVVVTGSGTARPQASATVSPLPSVESRGQTAEYQQVRQIDTSQFPVEVYGSRATVLVDFTAEWCQPCQQQQQFLQQFAWQNGTVKVVQVDVDRNRQLAQQFRVTTLPTLVVMRDAREVQRHVGLADVATLQALLP